MVERFAQWYSEAAVEVERDAIPLREEAVSRMKKEVEGSDLPDLVRLALRLPTKGEEVPEWLVSGFQSNDAKFSRTSKFEHEILAGALLVSLMDAEKDDAIGDAAALTLVAASLRGNLKGEFQHDFVRQATTYLQQRSTAIRSDSKLPVLKATVLQLDAAGASNVSVAHADLEKAAKAIGSLQRHIAALTTAISTRAQLQQEEIDVAWWVFGGRLRSVDSRIDQMAPAAAPFVAGAELGQMIAVLPGPASAAGLLDRMLAQLGTSRPESLAYKAVVSSTPPGWQSTWLESVDESIAAAEILPLSSLIAQAQRGAAEGELTPWAKRTLGLHIDGTEPALGAALQMYIEALAAKALTQSWTRSE